MIHIKVRRVKKIPERSLRTSSEVKAFALHKYPLLLRGEISGWGAGASPQQYDTVYLRYKGIL